MLSQWLASRIVLDAGRVRFVVTSVPWDVGDIFLARRWLAPLPGMEELGKLFLRFSDLLLTAQAAFYVRRASVARRPSI